MKRRDKTQAPRRVSVALALALCGLAPMSAAAQSLSPEDRQAYRAAFHVARGGDWATAQQIAGQASDKLPDKVLRWLELTTNPNEAFGDIVTFADANPDWPGQVALRQRAEDASADVPDELLLPYFQKHHPTTPKGRLRYADMLAKAGQRDAAVMAARELWASPDLDPDTEAAVLARYGTVLRPEDHWARLDRLIADGQSSAAQRVLPMVPPQQQQLAAARLALVALQPDAPALAAQLPAALQEDAALQLDRLHWARRKDDLDDAVELLRNQPADTPRLSAWWTERQIVTRRLIDADNDIAYELVSHHGLAEGTPEYADAEFLSGWIALRRLGDAQRGYDHFTRLYAAVKMPVSRARAAYWAGRAAEQMGAHDDAQRWLDSAAGYGATYYGQLAAARRGRPSMPSFPPLPQPTAEESAAFAKRELVRAARDMADIGDSDIVKLLLIRLEALARSSSELKLIADLSAETRRPDVAITAARRAGSDGMPWLEPGYPVIPIERSGPAEMALVLAITRQESLFDENAVSRSDARGLMQLKPSTARDVARSLGLPFSAQRLLTDPAYNLRLGQTYLGKMLDSFGGAYVLAIAAYNAGPARVTNWLAAFGDPRDGTTDVVDWVEQIPFNETRNYVQRVLENVQVYRLRLGDSDHAFTLAQDLRH